MSQWQYALGFPAEHSTGIAATCTCNTAPKHVVYVRWCANTFFYCSMQPPQFHISRQMDRLDAVDLLLGLHALRTSIHWTSILGGHFKSLVYETPMDTPEDVLVRIVVAAGNVPWSIDVFQHVRQCLQCRCHLCDTVHRRNLEQLL